MRAIRGLCSTAQQMSKAKKGNAQQVEAKVTGPVIVDKNGNIKIQIWAKPGAKCSTITDINEDGIGVQIAGKAVDGEANAELLKYMSGLLNLKKNEISLDKGSKSRQKTLLISKNECTVEEILSKLRGEMGK